MLSRWLLKPHFKTKERLLKSAVDAYKAQNSIAVLKIVLTEIEGILDAAYHTETGGRAKLSALLDYAVKTAERKAGGADTLFFPSAFAEYLQKYTYHNQEDGFLLISIGARIEAQRAKMGTHAWCVEYRAANHSIGF